MLFTGLELDLSLNFEKLNLKNETLFKKMEKERADALEMAAKALES